MSVEPVTSQDVINFFSWKTDHKRPEIWDEVDGLVQVGKTYAHAWPSNFWMEPDGTCVEVEYQAHKLADPEQQASFIAEYHGFPGAAKNAGRSLSLRPDWEDVKVHVMTTLVRQKLLDHPTVLFPAMTLTQGRMLVEGNYWHDNFWGNCFCSRCHDKPGHNALGIILTSLRVSLLST